MRFALVLILALITTTARAQVDPAIPLSSYTSVDEKLQTVLNFVSKNQARKFGWPENYQSLWCPTNIFNLLKRLDQAHVDLSRANVWYILPNADGSEGVIHPRVARPTEDGKTPREWAFHVVLELDGRIMDLDFTSKPDVVSVVSYAGAMWEKGPFAVARAGETLFVRQIPARDYLAQYSNNWSYFQEGGRGRYPAVDMSELVSSIVAH